MLDAAAGVPRAEDAPVFSSSPKGFDDSRAAEAAADRAVNGAGEGAPLPLPCRDFRSGFAPTFDGDPRTPFSGGRGNLIDAGAAADGVVTAVASSGSSKGFQF